jgi:BASS family bile acid:Na+ symporter
MTRVLKNIILNRNVILILALVLGLTMGDFAFNMKPYTLYILMVTMVFSMTGIETKALFPLKNMVRPMLVGTFLNFFIFGSVVVLLAWFLMPNKELFYGFVVIATAPPGVAIVPFSGILKGNMNYSIIGILGAFLASIIITPIVIGLFTQGESVVSSLELTWLMVQLIIIPLIVSRLLLMNPVDIIVRTVRGKVVDIGFALIIYTAVGINSAVFFRNFDILMLITLVLIVGTFGIGSLFEYFMKRRNQQSDTIIPKILLLTIKSSGFSVVTAITLFGEKAAIPSAVLAVIVLLYLLFLTSRMEIKKALGN